MSHKYHCATSSYSLNKPVFKLLTIISYLCILIPTGGFLMKFLTAFSRDCITLVTPLLALIVLVTILHLSGKSQLASFVSSFGTALVVLANVIYIVAIHSRSRWPGTTWFQRWTKLVTFQR